MGVFLLQILQWILRIILFLLLLILILVAMIQIVPIRYQAEGGYLEKKPGIRGKITWFFYLIYMKFCYEEEFHIQVRVFGFKIFDSANGSDKKKSKEESRESTENKVEETSVNSKEVISIEKKSGLEKELTAKSESSMNHSKTIDELTAREKEEEAEPADKVIRDQSQERSKSLDVSQEAKNDISENEKKSFSDKAEEIKLKIQDMIHKIRNIIAKIQTGKLKVEHYLELWNREETQITFNRAKLRLGRTIKAVLPGKWKLTGEIGFADPCTTGQFMGALGAMYPILGNKVQIMPNFENEVMNIEGSVKGHIRLGNLLYQLVSLILNRYCFKFIKLVFDELGSVKKS